mgnify:CR=1 FL=1
MDTLSIAFHLCKTSVNIKFILRVTNKKPEGEKKEKDPKKEEKKEENKVRFKKEHNTHTKWF